MEKVLEGFVKNKGVDRGLKVDTPYYRD